MYATCDQIIEGLFLGNCQAAQRLNMLKRNKITHVLVAAFGLPQPFPNNFEYKQFKILDFPTENISKYFDTAVRWIDDAIKSNGRVFVHCMAGISRSSTMVIAYLIYKGWGYHEAFTHCKNRHRDTFPNFGFQRQLQNYELKLKRAAEAKKEPNSEQLQTPVKNFNEVQNSQGQEEGKIQLKQFSPSKLTMGQFVPAQTQVVSQTPIQENKKALQNSQSPQPQIGIGNSLLINQKKIYNMRSLSQTRSGGKKYKYNQNNQSQENSPLKQGFPSSKNQLAKMKQLNSTYMPQNSEKQVSGNNNFTNSQEKQTNLENQKFHKKANYYNNIGKGQPRLTQSYQIPVGSFKGIKKST